MSQAVRNARSRYRPTSSSYARTSPSLASPTSSSSSSGRPSTERSRRFEPRYGSYTGAAARVPSGTRAVDQGGDAGGETGQLHRDHDLGARRSRDLLERVEVLQGHRLLVDALRGLEDLLQREGE